MLPSNRNQSGATRRTLEVPKWIPRYRYERGDLDLKGNIRKLVYSYAPDWAITIIIAAAFIALGKVTGYKREFSLEDTSLRHTYARHERVPPFALYIICFFAPLILQAIIDVLTIRSWWDLHTSYLGLILSLALTGAVTEAVKLTVGRPRPDLIDRCQPQAGAVDAYVGLSTSHICTETDWHIINDGWKSFPSGHSSMSFAGLGFLSFYLVGKVHLFDQRGRVTKAWLALTPLLGAALVAISRTMDYRHHWHDVLAGSILGLVMAYFAYRQYYPRLGSSVSHQPFPPRITLHDELLPTHLRTLSASPAAPMMNGEEFGYTDNVPEDNAAPGSSMIKPANGHDNDIYGL